MALLKRNALSYQPVQIGSVHVRVAKFSDGVVSLLVGNDENDIGSIIIGDWLVDKHVWGSAAVVMGNANAGSRQIP